MVRYGLVNDRYNFPDKWTVDDFTEAQAIFKNGVLNKSSASTIINNLKSAGLSYRRTNMLNDISLAKAIEHSADYISESRAVQWFDTIEQIRERLGFTTRVQAIDYYQRWKDESFDTLEEAELASELEDGDWMTPGRS